MKMKIKDAVIKAANENDVRTIAEFRKVIKKLTGTKLTDKGIDNYIYKYFEDESIPNKVITDDGKIHDRSSLFKSTRFKMKLSDEEFDDKIMYIGHRFIPFIDSNVKANDIIFAANDGIKMSKKIIKRKFSDITMYLSLIDTERIKRDYKSDNDTIELIAFDLSKWMKTIDFKKKDCLIVSVLDANIGSYSFEKFTARQLKEDALIISNKDAELEENILELLDDKIIPVDICLLKAFANSSEHVYKYPGSWIGNFIGTSENLEIHYDGHGPCLMGLTKIEDMMFDSMLGNLPEPGVATDLEGIFAELGNSFSEASISLKIVLQINDIGKIDKSELYSHIFKPGYNPFHNAKQEMNFEKAIDKLTAKLKKNWRQGVFHPEVRTLLGELFDFKVEIIKMLRDIDANIDLENFDPKFMFPLQQFEMMAEQMMMTVVSKKEEVTLVNIGEVRKSLNMLIEKFREVKKYVMSEFKLEGI